MVMKIEPIFNALQALRRPESKVVLMSAMGRPLKQGIVETYSREKHLILLCGHYEGVDQRVADHLVDDEISIGDYVLSGGELPACVLVDALARLIPGVISDAESALTDSFQDGLLDAPMYTRPASFRGMDVPDVLMSGNHEVIREWRDRMRMEKTRRIRPDLLGE